MPHRVPLQELQETAISNSANLSPEKVLSISSSSAQIRMANVRCLSHVEGQENGSRKEFAGIQLESVLRFNLNFAKQKENFEQALANFKESRLQKKPAVRANSCDAKFPSSMSSGLQPCIDMTNVRIYKKPIDNQKIRLPERTTRRRYHSDSAARKSKGGLYDSLGGAVLDMSRAKTYVKKMPPNDAVAERPKVLNCRVGSENTGSNGFCRHPTTRRSCPRNPSYLAAIDEALRKLETSNGMSLATKTDRGFVTRNGPLKPDVQNSVPQKNKDACTMTDDLCCSLINAGTGSFTSGDLPCSGEKSWKRLNILQLFGSDCDQDLSSLCQLAKEGKLSGRYGRESVDPGKPDSPEGENGSSSSGIGSFRCESSLCKPVLQLSNENSTDNANGTLETVCPSCQSTTVMNTDHTQTLVDSLNDSMIPNYMEGASSSMNNSFDSYTHLASMMFDDEQDSQSSSCTVPEKYDKFAESYKQNLVVVCKVCQSELPLPHRLSLKLNCGIGVEFSHGSSKGHQCLPTIPQTPDEQPCRISSRRAKSDNYSYAKTNLDEAFIDSIDNDDVFYDNPIVKEPHVISRGRETSQKKEPKSESTVPKPKTVIDKAIKCSIQKYVFHSNSADGSAIQNSEVDYDETNCYGESVEFGQSYAVNADTTTDFSNICIIDRCSAYDSDGNSTLCSSQFWKDSSSTDSSDSSSDSGDWNYTAMSCSMFDKSLNRSAKSASFQDLSTSLLCANMNDSSRRWSLEALPSRSFGEPKDELSSLVYRGYCQDVSGKGVIVELPPTGKVISSKSRRKSISTKKTKRRWSFGDVMLSPKDMCTENKCLCNCCLDLSSIQWPSSFTDQESDSEIKAAFSNPVHVRSFKLVGSSGSPDSEDEYVTLKKKCSPVPSRRHSTPQKELLKYQNDQNRLKNAGLTDSPIRSRQVSDSKCDADSEDLAIYFWNVELSDGSKPEVAALELANQNGMCNSSSKSTAPEKQYGITPKSLQCCCYCVHRDSDKDHHSAEKCERLGVGCREFNLREETSIEECSKMFSSYNRVEDLFVNSKRRRSSEPSNVTSKKYKAKDVICSKAQLQVSIYVNCGHLTIHVISANKVSSQKFPVCNSYVKVAVFPEEASRAPCRTAVKEGSRTPVFDEKFSFEILPSDHDKRLLLSLWHRDMYTERSELLGCMSFGIGHILSKGQIGGWYRVLTEEMGQKKHFAVTRTNQKIEGSNGYDSSSPIPSYSTSPVTMEEDARNSLRNLQTHNLKKDGIDKKSISSSNELKHMGKTPFTISVEIPRGSKGFGFSVTWVQPVRVARVVADSPADQAGLKVGDRIIFIGHENVVKASDKTILKLIKNERSTLQLEVYRRGLVSLSSVPARQLEGITDSPASTSRFSNLSFTLSEFGSSTPTLMRGERGLSGRLPSSRIPGFNTPPISRHGGSWSRLSHDSTVEFGRRQAIYQLVTCEENFANLTYFGLERYVEPLRNKANIVSSTEHIVLFQNIEELVWLSEGFVERIMEGDLNAVGNSIGGIFLEKILELCGAYQFYCNGVPAADTLLTSKMLNPSFLQFLQDPPLPRERLDITSFIHRPVEHFREVLLLLQTILSHTETRHPDYDSLENVVETMKLYYKDITSTLDLLEPRVGTTAASGSSSGSAVTTGTTMEDLEQRLVFTKSAKSFKLCEPGRQWVFGSELQKQDGKIMKACWVMLFTDILVFTRVGRDKVLFVIEDPVLITSISRAYFNIKKKNTEFRLIVDRPKGDNQNALLAGLQKRHRAVVLRAESLELKTMWQSYIQRQVWLLRGHEQSNVVNPATPGTLKRLWQTACAETNNQKSNTQTPSKKITGTFVLGKKNKSKEPTFGRILPSSSGKRQFLLDFLEGRGRHVTKGFDTEPPDWDFDNDPLANLKGEDLAKLRQQMLSRKLPNYFEGEYEEFFFDDDEDEHKSSRGSTHSPAPTIRSNLSTPQRKHKVSPAMKPKKLSFNCPNDEIKKHGGSVDSIKSNGDRIINLHGDSKSFSNFAETVRGSIEKLIQHTSPSFKHKESPKLKERDSPKLQEKSTNSVDNISKPVNDSKDVESPRLTEKVVQNGSPKCSPLKKLNTKDVSSSSDKSKTSISSQDNSVNKDCSVMDKSKPTNCLPVSASSKDASQTSPDIRVRLFNLDRARPILDVKDTPKPARRTTLPTAIGSDIINKHLVKDSLQWSPKSCIVEEKISNIVNDLGSLTGSKTADTSTETLCSSLGQDPVVQIESSDSSEAPRSPNSPEQNEEADKASLLEPELPIVPKPIESDTNGSQLRVLDSPLLRPREMPTLKTSPRLKEKVQTVIDMFTSRGSRASSSSSEASVIERPPMDSTADRAKVDTTSNPMEKVTNLVSSFMAREQKTLGELVPKTPAVSRKEVRPTDLNLVSKPQNKQTVADLTAGFEAKAYSSISAEKAAFMESPAMKPRGLRPSNENIRSLNPLDSPKLLRERVQILKVSERQKVQMTYVESPVTKRRELPSALMYSPSLVRKADQILNVLSHQEKTVCRAEKTTLDSPLPSRRSVKPVPLVTKPEVAVRTIIFPELALDKTLISQSSIDSFPEDKSSSDTATVTEPELDIKITNLEEKEKVQQLEKMEPNEKVEAPVESSCTERKANSETSSGYQSEKASTDSPSVMHKETKTSKPSPSREDKSSRSDMSVSDSKTTKMSPKDKEKIEKTVVSPTGHEQKSDIVKSDKLTKDSPLPKHKDTCSAKLSPKQNDKSAVLSNENVSLSGTKSVSESLADSHVEKPPIKERKSLKQDIKPVKPSPDRKQKTAPSSANGGGGNGTSAASSAMSPKVEGKVKPQQSPSPAIKAAAKGKDTPKKETKKAEPAKKPANGQDAKQAKGPPQKTSDVTKIKSSEKVRKNSLKGDKSKDSDKKSVPDKPAPEKPKDSKDKKETSASSKFKEASKKVAADSKLKKDKESENKAELVKSSSEKVSGDDGTADMKDESSKAVPDNSSAELDKEEESRGKGTEDSAPKPLVDVSDKGVEKDEKGVSDSKIVQESLQKLERSKAIKHHHPKSSKKPEGPKNEVRDPSKSPQVADMRSRIRSRLEGKTNEGRSREGSPRLKKMRNDNKEFYFDADIEIDYPELVGTPRMVRKDSLALGRVQRCGSIVDNRRCGSFEEIQSLASHHHEVPKSRDVVWQYFAQRKDSFNSHSERDLTKKSGQTAAKAEPSGENTGNASIIAAPEPTVSGGEPLVSACPPGSGHCGEEVDQRYLSYRRDSYNSHTHRESLDQSCVVEVHRTGSGHTPAGQIVEKKVSHPPRREKPPTGPPGSAQVVRDVEYDVPHCVIHNHKKTRREVLVHVKQKEYEATDSSHVVEVVDNKDTVTADFTAPNGDELVRLGSSLDDMLKCEVWLMNQCGTVEVSSAKQSSVSEGNSSTLYPTKTTNEKSQETSSRKTPIQKCEPASGSPPPPSSRCMNGELLENDYEDGSGDKMSVRQASGQNSVPHPKESLEGKGLSKFKRKAAEIIKNQSLPSPKLNSKTSKVPNDLDSETVSKNSPRKASEASDKNREKGGKKSQAVNPYPKSGNTSHSSPIPNGSCVLENGVSTPSQRRRVSKNSDSKSLGKVINSSLAAQSPKREGGTSAGANARSSKIDGHPDMSQLVVILPEQLQQTAGSRIDEVNYMASTSKSGPVYVADLEQPCCSRTLPPNDVGFEEDKSNSFCAHANGDSHTNGPEEEWKINGNVPGLESSIAALTAGAKRKTNIKMGVKSKAGSQTGSPNLVRLAAANKLTNPAVAKELELEAEQTQQRQSTGSLARQEDEKKGRFNLFRRTTSPSKTKEVSEDHSAVKLLTVTEDKDVEVRTESNKVSWFPWRSPWRKALQECSSLPATPPTHTPTLLPRDTSAISSAAACHGSDGDLGSWYDDE